MDFRPSFKTIYVDVRVRDSDMVQRILRALPDTPVQIIEDPERFVEEAKVMAWAEGKKGLWLTRYEGNFVKPCPGTDRHYLCCDYWVINAQVNCPMDCTYCILQTYLNFPLITVYTNTEEVLDEIRQMTESHPEQLFRIGTGELTDSLVLDPLTRINERLIAHCASMKNVILELKTKTDHIEHLPVLKRRNAVLSWSLNPGEAVQSEEFKTARLSERLEAAKRALEKGYRLAFHFDPILDLPDWEEKYLGLAETLTRLIPESEVAWISLGSLRYPPELKKTLMNHFPHSSIASGELVRGLDGKMRYFRPIRTERFRRLYQTLRKSWKDAWIYLCMENAPVWNAVMGFAPDDNRHLDYLFHENLHRRFKDLTLPNPRRDIYTEGMVSAHKA